MKTLQLFCFVILFSIAFPSLGHSQSRAAKLQMASRSNGTTLAASKVKLKTKTGYKVVDYVPVSKVREGRNYVRFGKRRMMIAKQGRRIVSIKIMNRVGKWGPNVLGTGKQHQAFWCVGGICGCSGDTDCNDMFTTDLCGDAAVCVGDNCYCAQD